MSNLHALIDALTLARNSKDVSSVMILISKAVISLLEGLTPHIQVLTFELISGSGLILSQRNNQTWHS